MTTEIDLLNTIHEYADMGLDGLNQVIPLSSDPSFIRELQHQKSDYEEALKKSEELLEERHVSRGKEAGPVAKMMSTVMTRAKNLVDPSTSRLSEMVFQGNNMGITELTKGINDYQGEDKVVLSFAEEQLKQAFSERTRLVAVTHISNVLGCKTPIKRITELAKECGAVVVLDSTSALAASSTPSILSIPYEIDDYLEMFAKAAENIK